MSNTSKPTKVFKLTKSPKKLIDLLKEIHTFIYGDISELKSENSGKYYLKYSDDENKEEILINIIPIDSELHFHVSLKSNDDVNSLTLVEYLIFGHFNDIKNQHKLFNLYFEGENFIFNDDNDEIFMEIADSEDNFHYMPKTNT